MTINFPNDFYDFTSGSAVYDDEFNEWIQECIDHLEKNPDEQFYNISTGEGLVIVLKFYNDEKTEYWYDINVSRSYQNHSTLPTEIKQGTGV